MTELHEAVERGDYYFICDVLERDPSSMHMWNSDGETPFVTIFKSVKSCNSVDKLRIIQLFIDHGVDVNFQSKLKGKTLLHDAMEKLQFDAVKLLLENNANPNLEDKNNNTVVHSLTMIFDKNDEEFEKHLRMLLDYGANINATISQKTLLEFAIEDKAFSKAKILIKYGAKVKDVFKMMRNLLYYHPTHFIDFLFNYKFEEYSSGCISMHKMLQYLRYKSTIQNDTNIMSQEFISECLKKRYGANVTKLEIKKKSALLVAVMEIDEKKIQFLLDHGADVNCRDNFNSTSLHKLLLFDYYNMDLIYRIAKLLISKGVNVEAKNDFGQDPLNLAIKLNNFHVIKLLLSKISGVRETYLEKDSLSDFRCIIDYRWCKIQLSALDVAVILGYDEVVDRLIEINVTSKSIRNRTKECSPLKYAFKMKRTNIIEKLLEADFKLNNSFNRIYCMVHNDLMSVNVCLICEYGNLEFIRNFVLFIIDEIVHDRIYKIDKFYHLVVYYYAINLKISKSTVDPLEHCFKTIPKLASILNFCNEKLNELKQKILYDNKSIYNIMCMRFTTLAYLMRKPEFLSACMLEMKNPSLEDENYKIIFNTRISLASKRSIRLEKSETFLNEVFYPVLTKIKYVSLPIEIIRNIISNLNCRDLERITKHL